MHNNFSTIDDLVVSKSIRDLKFHINYINKENEGDAKFNKIKADTVVQIISMTL